MKKSNIPIERYQALLLDFDGVLAESMSVKTEAFIQLFEPFGDKIVKKVVNHHIKHGGISRYEKIKYYYKQYLKTVLSDKDVDIIAQKFSDIVVSRVIESDWVKGAEEFLEKYHNNLDLFVISGTPQKEMDLIIKKRGMEKYFKGIYGTPDTKPVLAKRIINENKYNPDKVLYIGDCLSDYYDAQKANIPFLGRVPNGVNSIFPKEVSIITDFFELLK